MRNLRRRRPDADEIIPGLLVGSAPDHRQRTALRRSGVTAVLDLRAEATGDDPWPAGVTVRHAPVQDGQAPDPGRLHELAGWAVERVHAGDTVLVHCRAGVGRSATVACAILLRLGYDLGSAYRTVRDRRPAIVPTDAQLAVLRRYANARPTDERGEEVG
jgi:protein-tyrosine phosphatase